MLAQRCQLQRRMCSGSSGDPSLHKSHSEMKALVEALHPGLALRLTLVPPQQHPAPRHHPSLLSGR